MHKRTGLGIGQACTKPNRTEQSRLVERAKIVLACLSGKRNDQVAAEMDFRPNTVGIWRNRFATQGLSCLRDKASFGKPATYDHPGLRQRILAQLEMPCVGIGVGTAFV